MEEKKNSFILLYIILALCALALIFTGLLLSKIFAFFSVNINETALYILKMAFIISGFLDILLIFYAKKKLG